MTLHARVKFSLLSIAALFLTVFAWSAVQGQIQPPIIRPPIGPRRFQPPGMNPGGFPRHGPVIVKVWTCTGCGRELGRGLSAPPDHCPGCGARILNGVGNGLNPNPPAMNPNPPSLTPVNNSSANVNPSSSSSSGSGKGTMIALVIGIIVVGLGVLAGGTWLMIHTMKTNDSDSSRRRRRRDDDD